MMAGMLRRLNYEPSAVADRCSYCGEGPAHDGGSIWHIVGCPYALPIDDRRLLPADAELANLRPRGGRPRRPRLPVWCNDAVTTENLLQARTEL